MAYKDELLLEKAEKSKKKKCVQLLKEKERKKCKNMSKIEMKKNYKQFKWL